MTHTPGIMGSKSDIQSDPSGITDTLPGRSGVVMNRDIARDQVGREI